MLISHNFLTKNERGHCVHFIFRNYVFEMSLLDINFPSDLAHCRGSDLIGSGSCQTSILPAFFYTVPYLL
jgi:hypothetical protein